MFHHLVGAFLVKKRNFNVVHDGKLFVEDIYTKMGRIDIRQKLQRFNPLCLFFPKDLNSDTVKQRELASA